jgi:hypothetical protein
MKCLHPLDQNISSHYIAHIQQSVSPNRAGSPNHIFTITNQPVPLINQALFHDLLTFNSPINDTIIQSFLSRTCSIIECSYAIDTNLLQGPSTLTATMTIKSLTIVLAKQTMSTDFSHDKEGEEELKHFNSDQFDGSITFFLHQVSRSNSSSPSCPTNDAKNNDNLDKSNGKTDNYPKNYVIPPGLRKPFIVPHRDQ